MDHLWSYEEAVKHADTDCYKEQRDAGYVHCGPGSRAHFAVRTLHQLAQQLRSDRSRSALLERKQLLVQCGVISAAECGNCEI